MGKQTYGSWLLEVPCCRDGSREDTRDEDHRVFLGKLRSFLFSVAPEQSIESLIGHFSGRVVDSEVARQAGIHRANVARQRQRSLAGIRGRFVEGLATKLLASMRSDEPRMIHPFTGEGVTFWGRAVSLLHTSFDRIPKLEEMAREVDRKMDAVFHWKHRRGTQLFLATWRSDDLRYHLGLHRSTAVDGGPTAVVVS